jgi:putative salt-induced outer membrane protein
MRTVRGLLPTLAWIAAAAPAFAQAPPAEPKILTIQTSAGLALTSGNTDTSTISAAYNLIYDARMKHVVKSDALFIRGKTEGDLSANRFGLNIRDEYAVFSRAYIFGQNQYLRDTFKDLEYLIAPTLGAGYKLFDTARTKLAIDGGFGAAWEKNPGSAVETSGALSVAEKFSQALTATTTLTHVFTVLWKTDNFEDALYTVGVAIAAAISTRTQLKVEFIDYYKNLPPVPTIQKNDIAVLMAIVYKI